MTWIPELLWDMVWVYIAVWMAATVAALIFPKTLACRAVALLDSLSAQSVLAKLDPDADSKALNNLHQNASNKSEVWDFMATVGTNEAVNLNERLAA